MAAVVAALALAACSGPTVGTTVARVDNIVLTRQALDQRIAQMKAAAEQPLQADQELERRTVNQFVQVNLVLSLAHRLGVAVEDQEVNDQIEAFRSNVQSQGNQTLDQAVRSQLGLPGENSPEFRQLASSVVAQQKLAETLVTSDTVRQELTAQMMAQTNEMVDQVHVAHILVQTEVEVKQVLNRLAQGEAFEALAQELSLDTNSGAKGGELGWFRQGETTPELDQLIFDQLKPGEIAKTAIQTQAGYHIVKVLAREQRPMMTQEEAQQTLEANIAQTLQQRRSQALQQFLTEERAKAKNEQRLIEPEFAEQAPEPAPEEIQPTPAQ
jgi:parvulin-like peptidyl-prolyl isomerase